MYKNGINHHNHIQIKQNESIGSHAFQQKGSQTCRQTHKWHAQTSCRDWDWRESPGLRSASARYTKQVIRPLIKRQLFFTRVSPSLTPASSSSNDDKTEGGWTPDGDDLLKEQVKWKQSFADRAPHLLTTTPSLCASIPLIYLCAVMLRWYSHLGQREADIP